MPRHGIWADFGRIFAPCCASPEEVQAATKVQSIARMSLAGQAWLGVGLGLGPGLGLSLTSKHVARRAGRLTLNLTTLTLTLTLIRTRT